MEVHHHPDLHHKPKPWKEYLLEGLMIFLAVTMGFFAESIREHLTDRTKEKEYMHSLIEELKYDTLKYDEVISKIAILNITLDSSYTNIKEAKRFNYILLGKWQFFINQEGVEYRPGLTTIQQMKNSGNLRLIENKEGSKKVMEYEAEVEASIERTNDYVAAARGKVYALEDALCDYSNFRKTDLGKRIIITDTTQQAGYNMPIMTKDILKLNEFANSFINYKASNTSYKRSVEHAKQSAIELINLINKEYNF